ncbi:MAG: hypothetical protein QM756_21065 [Polyangiaceae bacterium]
MNEPHDRVAQAVRLDGAADLFLVGTGLRSPAKARHQIGEQQLLVARPRFERFGDFLLFLVLLGERAGRSLRCVGTAVALLGTDGVVTRIHSGDGLVLVLLVLLILAALVGRQRVRAQKGRDQR